MQCLLNEGKDKENTWGRFQVQKQREKIDRNRKIERNIEM